MQPITLEYNADLRGGIGLTAMPTLFAQGDSLAHVIRVRVKNDGEAVDIEGWNVAAELIRQDQVTVPLTGQIVDGAAEVTLETACYARSGGFTLTVSLQKDGQTITVFCGRGDVTRTRTDTIIGAVSGNA